MLRNKPILARAIRGGTAVIAYAGITGVIEGKDPEKIAEDMLLFGGVGTLGGAAVGMSERAAMKAALADELRAAAREIRSGKADIDFLDALAGNKNSEYVKLDEVFAPNGEIITVRTKGNVQIPIGKVEKYMRGDVVNPINDLKEMNALKQNNRKLFDSNPENQIRLDDLNKKWHTYTRSIDMANKLESIGLGNNAENNNLIYNVLFDAGKQATADNRIIKSLLVGPNGKLKVISIWRVFGDGSKYLSTIMLIPVK